jgi:hypothetical protein
MGKIALQRVVRCRAVISLIREVKICTALNKENTVFCCAENAVVGFSATGNNISVKPSDLMLKYVENKRVRLAIVFEH